MIWKWGVLELFLRALSLSPPFELEVRTNDVGSDTLFKIFGF